MSRPRTHLAAMPLHLTKVAVGCGDAETLRDRLLGRATGDRSFVSTRFRPTRAAEIDGGSLYWIVKHRLVARSPILGFDEEEGGRCRILVATALLPVRTTPKRAHQGWRYLRPEDAPADLGEGEAAGLAELPHALAAELALLALI